MYALRISVSSIVLLAANIASAQSWDASRVHVIDVRRPNYDIEARLTVGNVTAEYSRSTLRGSRIGRFTVHVNGVLVHSEATDESRDYNPIPEANGGLPTRGWDLVLLAARIGTRGELLVYAGRSPFGGPCIWRGRLN